MIWAFYVLAIGSVTLLGAFYSVLAYDPDRSPFYHRKDKEEDYYYNFMDVIEIIGCECWRLLSWLVLLITFQLAMALRVILKK